MNKGFIILLSIVMVNTVFADTVDPLSESHFYVETYGVIDSEQSTNAKRAKNIFAKLLTVVDRAKPKNPTLTMVDSKGWPWAIALPDNTVILSKGAIELCYENASIQQGDARLAMLLGHELTHLSENDYWHRDVYVLLKENNYHLNDEILKFMKEYAGLGNQSSKQRQEYIRNKEIIADDMGFMYASLAGFDTSHVIDVNGESFFQYWKRKTGVKEDDYHFSANLRTDYIQARFENLRKLPEMYYIGLAFIHLDYLDQAKLIFDQILTQFPSYEVYNNLGYIYLLKSNILSHLSEQDMFWLPTLLDGELKSPIFSRGDVSSKYPAETLSNLENAAQQFELSLSKRPGYLKGTLNLASVYFYLGKYHKAYALLKEAKQFFPENQKIDELLKLSSYHDLKGTIDDLSSKILEGLEKGVKNNNNDLSRYFNLARMYELSENKTKAQVIWKRLSEQIDKIVEPYQSIVLKKIAATNSSIKTPAVNNQIRLPNQCLHRKPNGKTESLVKLDDNEIYLVHHDSVLKEYKTLTQTFYISCVLPTEILKQLLAQFNGSLKRVTKTTMGEIVSFSDNIAVFITGAEQSELWFR